MAERAERRNGLRRCPSGQLGRLGAPVRCLSGEAAQALLESMPGADHDSGSHTLALQGSADGACAAAQETRRSGASDLSVRPLKGFSSTDTRRTNTSGDSRSSLLAQRAHQEFSERSICVKAWRLTREGRHHDRRLLRIDGGRLKVYDSGSSHVKFDVDVAADVLDCRVLWSDNVVQLVLREDGRLGQNQGFSLANLIPRRERSAEKRYLFEFDSAKQAEELWMEVLRLRSVTVVGVSQAGRST